MIWAKLSDIVGRKYILITCLCIFTLFSGLCGAAQTIDQLIMFRWCQGMGGGGVFGLVQLIFIELVPRRKLPAYLTMVTAALALSLVVGPLLGGGITLHGSWRWVFLIKYVLPFLDQAETLLMLPISVPIGALTALSLCVTLPRTLWNEPAAQLTQSAFTSASLRRLDVLGAVLMVGTITFLSTGFQQAAQGYAWSSPMVLGLLVTTAPLAVLFFTWQWYVTMRRTNPEPVFPWRICQSRIRIGMIL
jgi:MFS family permease